MLLLDEPFAALDAQTRVVIQNDVVKICRAGRRSMIIVTHDIAEAISMADRVVVVGRGKVLAAKRLLRLQRTTLPRPRR